MKKKIFSLILVLVLLPIASLFSACGKNKIKDLSNIDNEFYSIADENNNIELKNGKLVFTYAGHNNFDNVINTVAPYNQLKNYNIVFYNLIAFTNQYIDECSNNSNPIDKELRNQINSDLKNFKKSVKDVNECVNLFAELINVSQGTDLTSETCLSRYNNLLNAYEEVFEKSINLHNSLSNIYYNHVLMEGNPNIYSTSLENFDAANVVSKLASRIVFQISNLSQNYVEMHISGGQVAENIAFHGGTLDLNVYNYISNVNVINKTFEEQAAAEKANNASNKQAFYNLSITAYNIQETINNDREKFVDACNSIDYKIAKDGLNTSAEDKMRVQIIEDNHSIITTYNNVLKQMVDIVTT